MELVIFSLDEFVYEGNVEVVVKSEVSPRQLLVSVGSSFVCMFVVLSEPQTFYALLSLITKKRK